MKELSPEGQLIGYARVSTEEQNLDMQTVALERAGCSVIYSEKTSSGSKKRPELDNAIANLEPGDVFVVWRLDRLARSMLDLLRRVEQIEKAGAQFRSLTEGFDTTTISGRLLLHLLGAIAEFERQLTRERTVAGLARAKERGAQIGAKKKVTDKVLKRMVDLSLQKQKNGRWAYNRGQIAGLLKISAGTYDMYMKPVGGVSGVREIGDAGEVLKQLES